jgi:hypothetical protein
LVGFKKLLEVVVPSAVKKLAAEETRKRRMPNRPLGFVLAHDSVERHVVEKKLQLGVFGVVGIDHLKIRIRDRHEKWSVKPPIVEVLGEKGSVLNICTHETVGAVEMPKKIDRRMTLEWAEDADEEVHIGILIDVTLDLGGKVEGNSRGGARHRPETDRQAATL